MPCGPSRTTVKPIRRSSAAKARPASAGCTSATASRASGYCSNVRLVELQSAIGRIQFQRLSEYTAARTRNALPPEGITYAWYKSYAFVKPDALAAGWNRDRILSEIAALGYPALSGSCSEIYLERCFQEAGLAPAERLPVARDLGETSLMFLVHPTITPEQMTAYAEAVRSVVVRACR